MGDMDMALIHSILLKRIQNKSQIGEYHYFNDGTIVIAPQDVAVFRQGGNTLAIPCH